jgi:hypothetical protein
VEEAETARLRVVEMKFVSNQRLHCLQPENSLEHQTKHIPLKRLAGFSEEGWQNNCDGNACAVIEAYLEGTKAPQLLFPSRYFLI